MLRRIAAKGRRRSRILLGLSVACASLATSIGVASAVSEDSWAPDTEVEPAPALIADSDERREPARIGESGSDDAAVRAGDIGSALIIVRLPESIR
ncbi:MAG: hypothetical protein GY925_15410 [Actinomycetia bacterium]|nr:hypothetical protein [Actinomycetes bacterium]